MSVEVKRTVVIAAVEVEDGTKVVGTVTEDEVEHIARFIVLEALVGKGSVVIFFGYELFAVECHSFESVAGNVKLFYVAGGNCDDGIVIYVDTCGIFFLKLVSLGHGKEYR